MRLEQFERFDVNVAVGDQGQLLAAGCWRLRICSLEARS